jgi:two-component system sensor histidine kinase/response regulator
VQDTGIGITREALPRLFTAFMQADQSMSRRFGGTGLGLAITRQLVDLMGGRIEAESDVGIGSRFHFDLPFAAGAGQPVARGEVVSLDGRRVLVVEDNPTNRAILEGHLGAFGVAVATAENGRQALELLRTAARAGQLFDAALIDMHMPVMNGLAMAQAVRREAELATLRLVMLTSLASGDEPMLAQKSGIDAFLTKPVRQQELVNVLSDLFAAAPLAAASGDGGAPAGGAAPAPAPSPALPAAPGLHVLLVEDNPVNQEVAREMLQLAGLEVEVADDGAQAVERVRALPFDLVLMDVHMPVMDGLEATRRIRTLDDRAHLPILAMTANAFAEDRAACLAAGMDEVLVKPAGRVRLLQTVQQALQAHAAAADAAN